MKNIGKVFEDDFKKSVPKDMYYLRLHDSATGFNVRSNVRSNVRFSIKSPYDAILCKDGQMCCVELKSVGGTSASFGDHPNHTIKFRQVKELLKAENEGHALSYLVIHFRKYGETYAIRPMTFLTFTKLCSKKSINRSDCERIGLRIPEKKIRTRMRYDLITLFRQR